MNSAAAADFSAVDAPECPARTAPWPAAPASSINVLLVEDDAADTSLILDVLRRHPGIASAAGMDEPEFALRELGAGRMRPDLILLDIHMPQMDGFQFLNRLRQITSMAEMPVVLLTTSRLGRDVRQAARSSALLYVVKPDTYAALASRLDEVINRAMSAHRKH
jgi:CheY-like chemotaxis protein